MESQGLAATGEGAGRGHSGGRRRDGSGPPGPGDHRRDGRDGRDGGDGGRGEQYLGQRKAEKLVTQRR